MRNTHFSLWTNFKYILTHQWLKWFLSFFYQAFLKHFFNFILLYEYYLVKRKWGKKSECFACKEFAPLWTWSANTYIVEYVVLCSSDIWTKQLWVYEACQPSMQLCCYRFVCYLLELILNQNVMILDPSHYPYENSFCSFNPVSPSLCHVSLPSGNRGILE